MRGKPRPPCLEQARRLSQKTKIVNELRATDATTKNGRGSSRKGDLAALRSAVRDTRVCMQRLRAGGSLDKGSSPSWRAAAREWREASPPAAERAARRPEWRPKRRPGAATPRPGSLMTLSREVTMASALGQVTEPNCNIMGR